MSKKKNTIFWLTITIIGIISLVLFLRFFINKEKERSYFKSGNLTTIAFDSTIIDLGSLIFNQPKEAVFSFINTGSNPLIIHTVRASCGCTLPVWPKKAILPGKAGIISVTYNASDIGFYMKIISVVANTTPNQINLTIQGEVKWE